MKTYKLQKMPYAQACVRDYGDGHIVLQSYATDVIIIKDGVMHVTGLYSMTTRKHIGAFMREYANAAYDIAKACYETGCGYDLRKQDFIPT